ncbi:unnamed protein product, partial [Prorocentrum cordatum]
KKSCVQNLDKRLGVPGSGPLDRLCTELLRLRPWLLCGEPHSPLPFIAFEYLRVRQGQSSAGAAGERSGPAIGGDGGGVAGRQQGRERARPCSGAPKKTRKQAELGEFSVHVLGSFLESLAPCMRHCCVEGPSTWVELETSSRVKLQLNASCHAQMQAGEVHGIWCTVQIALHRSHLMNCSPHMSPISCTEKLAMFDFDADAEVSQYTDAQREEIRRQAHKALSLGGFKLSQLCLERLYGKASLTMPCRIEHSCIILSAIQARRPWLQQKELSTYMQRVSEADSHSKHDLNHNASARRHTNVMPGATEQGWSRRISTENHSTPAPVLFSSTSGWPISVACTPGTASQGSATLLATTSLARRARRRFRQSRTPSTAPSSTAVAAAVAAAAASTRERRRLPAAASLSASEGSRYS